MIFRHTLCLATAASLMLCTAAFAGGISTTTSALPGGSESGGTKTTTSGSTTSATNAQVDTDGGVSSGSQGMFTRDNHDGYHSPNRIVSDRSRQAGQTCPANAICAGNGDDAPKSAGNDRTRLINSDNQN